MNSPGFILAVGGANLDIVACANHPLNPGDSTPGTVRSSPGGVARNVAHNLARLGHHTRLISAVGDDPPGHALLAATQQAGVDVSGCPVLPGVATASYVAVHDSHGDMVLAVNDMQALEHIAPAALEPHAAQVRGAAALLVDCNLSDAALDWLFAHRGSTPVFADAVSAFKCRRLLPWLAQVHTLKVNRLEARALSGLPADSPAEVEAAAGWLHGQGVCHVVLSLGEQGLYYSAQHGEATSSRQTPEHGWQAALPVTVLNTTGAGDALMAGLIHSHRLGWPLARAARFAAGCAALALTVPCANHPGLCAALVEELLDTPPSA